MAQPCSICCHEKRAAIDRAIQDGSTLASISADFGVSYSALRRHRKHIKDIVQRAAAKKERDLAKECLGWLDEAHDIARRGALMAEEDHKPGVMVQYAASTAALVSKVLEITDYRELKKEVEEIKTQLRGI